MPGKDGFEVLREIAGTHQPVVVFITAHDEHAIQAFDVQALDYVLKPLVEERLLAAVRRAVSRFHEQRRGDLADAMARLLERVDRSRRDGRVAVRSERGVTLIPAADIHWVEADGDLVTIHTARARHVLRTTMADIESRLATPPFTRVHRSAIVNVDCIQEIQPLFKGDYLIVLKSGVEIRTGRTHRANVQALMTRTLLKSAGRYGDSEEHSSVRRYDGYGGSAERPDARHLLFKDDERQNVPRTRRTAVRRTDMCFSNPPIMCFESILAFNTSATSVSHWLLPMRGPGSSVFMRLTMMVSSCGMTVSRCPPLPLAVNVPSGIPNSGRAWAFV